MLRDCFFLVMPSANTRTVVAAATVTTPAPVADYRHLHRDVEGLVLEIKENLRISSTCAVGALKALPAYRRYPKKYLRNSPYAARSADEQTACARRLLRHKQEAADDGCEDPYELLQRLLKDGGLVSEAVRRVQLAAAAATFATATVKTDYCYYDSEEECSSPMLRLCD